MIYIMFADPIEFHRPNLPHPVTYGRVVLSVRFSLLLALDVFLLVPLLPGGLFVPTSIHLSISLGKLLMLILCA